MAKSQDIITAHAGVKAVRDGDTYRVYFPYSPDAVAEIKTLPRNARRFGSVGQSKYWIVPASKIRSLKPVLARIAEIAVENDADRAARSAAIVEGARTIVVDAAGRVLAGFIGKIDGNIVRVNYVGKPQQPTQADIERLGLTAEAFGIHADVYEMIVTDATASDIVIYDEEKAEIVREAEAARATAQRRL